MPAKIHTEDELKVIMANVIRPTKETGEDVTDNIK